MDSPGTWETLRATHCQIAGGTVAWKSPPRRERTKGDGKWGRGSKYISDSVFVAGSLSALVVPRTLGNAAQVDPAEGSGAPLKQNRF
jgi:hypothetical protein